MTEQDYMRVSALTFLRAASDALAQAASQGDALPDALRNDLVDLNRRTSDLVKRAWGTFGVEE